MLQKYALRSLCFLAVLLLVPYSGMSAPSGKHRQQNITITLPAETVLATLQKILPLDIPSQSRHLQGDIVVESLDRLFIHDNIITAHGVLSGRNLTVVTNIAGQDIQLRVGAIRLPMACDLQTRFDPAQRKLYVTPRFADTGRNGNGQPDPLAPLLGALNGREYLVDLDALQVLNIRVGDRSIPIAMEPVHIAGTDNALIFHLHPRISTVK